MIQDSLRTPECQKQRQQLEVSHTQKWRMKTQGSCVSERETTLSIIRYPTALRVSKKPKSPFLSLAPVESFTKSHTQFKFMLYLISQLFLTVRHNFFFGYASSFWFVVFWSSCDKFSIVMKLFPGYMPFHMEQYNPIFWSTLRETALNYCHFLIAIDQSSPIYQCQFYLINTIYISIYLLPSSIPWQMF